MKYAAFLRGINVGGKNLLPMKDLAKMFEAAGCTDVRTYIQSGNVVFTANDAVAGAIGPEISRRIEKKFGLRVPVVVRSVKEMKKVAASHPHVKKGVDLRWVHVCFLLDKPDAKLIAVLDPERSPGDEFVVIGSEIYMHLPNGAGKSKLTNAYFDSKLKTVSTARNWNTVCTVLAMMEED